MGTDGHHHHHHHHDDDDSHDRMLAYASPHQHHALKRHPDQADVDALPAKRVHLDTTAGHARAHHHRPHHGHARGAEAGRRADRRSRAHSGSMPFNAFSRMHIGSASTSTPAQAIPQAAAMPVSAPAPAPAPLLLQPKPVRPVALQSHAALLTQDRRKPPSSFDISPHRTIVTSLSDDEDENEDQGLPINGASTMVADDDETLRSPSPPASAHFHLNPALAAQLAANPFGSKGGASTGPDDLWARTLSQAALSSTAAAPSDGGALVLYKPVTPKAAFVRPEDEEREDEDDEAQHTSTREASAEGSNIELDSGHGAPVIEEFDDAFYDSRAQTRPESRNRTSSASSDTTTNGNRSSPSSRLRIIELADGFDSPSISSASSSASESSSAIYPTIETPPSPNYCGSSASTVTLSSLSSASSASSSSVAGANGRGQMPTIDLSSGAPVPLPATTTAAPGFHLSPQTGFAFPTPQAFAMRDLPPNASLSSSSSSSATPMATSTGYSTPVSAGLGTGLTNIASPVAPGSFSLQPTPGGGGSTFQPQPNGTAAVAPADEGDEAPMDLD